MNLSLHPLILLLVFPGGLFLMNIGLMYEWADRKLVARFQSRVGPRWFQPFADTVKLLAKEEIIPNGVHKIMFQALPIIALTGALTAALYIPMFGFEAAFSFEGDLIVSLYMLSMMTLSIGMAGANTLSRFTIIGATRALTQMFSYEAPFLLALLGPAIAAGTWNIGKINTFAGENIWLILAQPIGFIIAVVGLMGKLELPPFDSPEAETEIVAGALTEYSGRGLALFHIGKNVELVIGLTLVVIFYLGGIANPIEFILKSAGLFLVVSALQSMFARLRIDQTVGLWWRLGALMGLLQLLAIIFGRYLGEILR